MHPMKPFRALSAVEQLSAHFRKEIAAGRLQGTMPGVIQLVEELGVGTKTAVGALKDLERQGVIESQGPRRSSRILATASGGSKALRVVILLYERSNTNVAFLVDLRHLLQEAGYAAVFSSKSLSELGMDPGKVARHVKKTDADIWVVFVGSRPVLEWFAAQPFPSFALLGRGANVEIASLNVSKKIAISEILKHLVRLGHHRIVMLASEERRKPVPGEIERHFLTELQALGIPTSISYNLPDWESDPKGFHACLNSLFSLTPPTAILFDMPVLYTAALSFFARRGLCVPDDVSAVVLDGDDSLSWCDPTPTHLETNPSLWVNKVMRWVGNVSRGIEDHTKTVVKAKFFEGATIGPAPAPRMATWRS